MTKLFEDIAREPSELSNSLTYTLQEGRQALEDAAQILNKSAHIYIVGIGSSWNAGLAVLSFFNAAGRPALLFDASELLHFTEIPRNAAIIVLSRSGKSTEIVQLLGKLSASQATIIAVTNTPDSPLALQAHVVLKLMASFDHAVSISMYSALALTGGLLACASVDNLDGPLESQLQRSLSAAGAAIVSWQEQITESAWPHPQAMTYLLGRGASAATCHEGRLLWEEAAKIPASAMSTGGFRHGPQEVVREGLRVALWIDGERMRVQDLALAADLRKFGVNLLLIGQDVPADAGDLVLEIPAIRPEWQFLTDIIPIQIAAERLAYLGNQDCDSFRICPYIVEDEGGLVKPDGRLEEVARAE
jgi:glucosamine--fructose-6-phosphate aminotransferase (isomerizing)